MEDLYFKILEYIPFALMVLICLPIHEVAHGVVANKLGDDTAYYQGRLTLNPFAHLDIVGTLAMIFLRFGWAKPVPVNPTRFKCNMRLGMAFTALAGPVSNLLLSLVFMIFSKGVILIGEATNNEFFFFLNWIFSTMCVTNIYLAFFNLLPIPPLDGSRILNYFLPYRASQWYEKIERYSFIILIAFIYGLGDVFTSVVSFVGEWIIWFFDKITFFMGDMIWLQLSYFLN